MKDLRVKIFADGADKFTIRKLYKDPRIQGFTTNPSLMVSAGTGDYMTWARQLIADVPDKPVSLEVVSDEFPEMEVQAHKLAALGSNVYVKIPITNTRGESSEDLIYRLSSEGIKVNITAIMTMDQIYRAVGAVWNGTQAIISVFAGRIADTGVDPFPMMRSAAEHLRLFPQLELLWASPREVLNVVQADDAGCHIITVTEQLLNKMELLGKDLAEYSRETVTMFHQDANVGNLKI